jgi:hypothetical protein
LGLALLIPAAAGVTAGAAAGQETAWTPFPGAFPERADRSVVERPGSELRADGERLLRRRDGVEITLPCTSAEGTGRIRDLALDPAGLVFVAAERGLFVVSAELGSLSALTVSIEPAGSFCTPRKIVAGAGT